MGITCGQILDFSRNPPSDLGFIVSTQSKLFNLKVQLECCLHPGRVDNSARQLGRCSVLQLWAATRAVHEAFIGANARHKARSAAQKRPARADHQKRRQKAYRAPCTDLGIWGTHLTQQSGAGSKMEPAPLVSVKTLSAA